MSESPAALAWRVAAAAAPGGSHIRSGVPCQDALAFAKLRPGLLAVAVADGAGSASHAEAGAIAATQAAIASLSGYDDWQEQDATAEPERCAERLRAALTAALTAVQSRAHSLGVATRELASTFLLLVADAQAVHAIQIGDGAIVVCDVNDRLTAVTHPDAGEYINETQFLSGLSGLSAAAEVPVCSWRGPLANLAAFSDGLQLLSMSFPDWTPQPRFFLPLFSFLAGQADEAEGSRAIEELLVHDRIRQRTDDDATLLLAGLYAEAHPVGMAG